MGLLAVRHLLAAYCFHTVVVAARLQMAPAAVAGEAVDSKLRGQQRQQGLVVLVVGLSAEQQVQHPVSLYLEAEAAEMVIPLETLLVALPYGVVVVVAVQGTQRQQREGLQTWAAVVVEARQTVLVLLVVCLAAAATVELVLEVAEQLQRGQFLRVVAVETKTVIAVLVVQD
jgi:hypothetical protein